MYLSRLTEQFSRSISIPDVTEAGEVSGLFATAKAAFLAAFFSRSKGKVVFAAKNADSAGQVFDEIGFFLDKEGASVRLFETDGGQGNVYSLEAFFSEKQTMLITSREALFKKTYGCRRLKADLIEISQGSKAGTPDLSSRLEGSGFERTFMVEDEGEFSVRGGIIDVFLKEATGLRIEFLNDTVASLREFDLETQRSRKEVPSAKIFPVREKQETELIKSLPEGSLIILEEGGSANADMKELQGRRVIEMNTLARTGKAVNFECRLAPEYSAMIEPFIDDIKSGSEKVFIVSKQDARLKELFLDAGILKDGLEIVHGELPQGFHLPNQKILLFSDREIFGEHIPRRRFKVYKEKRAAKNLLLDLKEGDAVVHRHYGIGLYKGMAVQTVDGVSSDYLFIKYAGDDSLYLPANRIDLISKYNVPAEYVPKLNSLSSGEWGLTKSRAQKSVREMTKELLDIYSSRTGGQGFAYPKDGAWQAEIEGAFPYEETPDQAEAVRAVKADMESSKPMDRLLCADVGYGKTEVALRAAFKAASSGKQVALLCPTTLLSRQHYQLFKSRFAPFPFSVEVLSRFRTKEEQKETLKRIETGAVDVIIGTHRLLQKDILFKDLGLLVIDEEQRFGVSHKEKLKQIKRTVDVLSLSATPIPRTLYMALSGIWDISVIETAPPGRSKVETFVMPWKESTVRQAVEAEKERGGQVFYVFNSVEKIFAAAEKLKKIVPSCSIAVAHGRMKTAELESVMTDFIDGRYDVLLSTTIIESGLDIPNVNTIIIENPDRFGLSTLYQLRGRVGRSNVKAHAYLLYREGGPISGKALERLSAIKSFTALGSGYKIAMRDLEIRGAGNVLGAQQHGHMLAVGFDLYCDMLKEAAAHLKGEKILRRQRTQIDIRVSALVPESFIGDEAERIYIYKRADLIESEEDVLALEAEITDRFGRLPVQMINLLELVKLRILARKPGIKKIVQKKNEILFISAEGKRSINILGLSEKEVLIRVREALQQF